MIYSVTQEGFELLRTSDRDAAMAEALRLAGIRYGVAVAEIASGRSIRVFAGEPLR